MSLGGDKKIRRKPVRRKIMKKIWQKSLASMVSAALCLTAFVGCLTVNAAEYAGTISSAGTTVSETATEAKVTLTLSSPDAAMNIAAIAATTDFGTLTAVEVEGTNCKIDDIKDLAKGRFYVDAIDNNKGFNTAAVTLTFTKAEKVGVGNHPVTITYFAKKSAATFNEDIVNLTVSGDINITVTSATTEPISVALGCAHTLSLGNSIAITYSFRDKDVGTGTKVSEYCARVYAVITKERYADDGDLAMDTTIDCTLDSVSGMYSFKYKGLAAKEMSKTVTARIYGEDASGNVIMISKSPDVYGVLNYATSSVGFSGNDTNLKTCLADILNYGAAAQVYFGYNTSDLVNARDSVSSYVAEFSTVNDVVWTDNQQVSGSESFQVSPGFSLNSSIDMYVNVNPARLSSYDLNTIKVVFSFHNSKENKDYNIEVPYGDVDNFSGGSVYSFYCRELAAAQVNEDVYVAVYSGDQKISKTTKYSVETYCARLTAGTTDQNFIDLCQSIMKYGNSAKIVLGY